SSDLDYTGTGALTLNGGTIKDAAVNNATLTLASPGAAGSLGANKAIVVDTGAPTVSNVTSTELNGNYTIVGEILDITITFTENVIVTGTPQLELETGEADRKASYSSGTGTTTLTFQYTVQTGDITGDLDYTGTGALTLNSGTIKDAAGNNAILTLAMPEEANSLGANKTLVIAAPSAKVIADFVYDPDEDDINIVMYLESQGRQVTRGSTNTLRTGAISLYSSADAAVAMYTGSSATADANGNYWFTISDAMSTYSFAVGKKYYADLSVVYGTASDNVTYQSATSFDLGVSKKMKQVQTMAQSMSATVATQTSTISDAVIADVDADLTSIKSDTSSIVTAVGTTSLATQISSVSAEVSSVEYHVTSEILNREALIKMGDSLNVAYRAASGLSPTMTVYDADGTKVLDGVDMTEMGTTGIYTYDLTMLDSWGTGDFTIVCSESTQGTTDAMLLTSANYDLQDVAASTSAVLGQISRQSTLSAAAENISVKFSSIDTILSKLNTNIATRTTAITNTGTDMEFIYAKLKEISGVVKELGVSGPSLEKIYEVTESKKYNIEYLKNKTQELKAMMDISKKMIERMSDDPVIQSWLETK
ncbi:MAG: hypothetical protein KKF54_05525, partial [Candidatus Omnitrophica bacterium]|nr:hypothetical protein [Candidatus Omnitrophota bacterium]